MRNSVSCPNCGESLDIPPELRGRPVQCSACRTVFTPAGDDVPRIRPAARDADDDDRLRIEDELDRPRRRPPMRKSRSSLGLWLVLGVLALLACGCCGGIGVITWKFMDPNYKPYAAPDGKFDAIFPGDARSARRLTGRAGGESADALEARRDWVQELFFVYSLEPSAADKRKGNDKLLDEFADGLLVQTPGGREFPQRARRTHAGLPAMDITIQHPDVDIHTIARVVAAKDRIYVIGVTGPGQPGQAPWVEKYFDGFVPK